jgi:hypothetical protein
MSSVASRLLGAAARPLASTAGRKRSLVLLVAAPLGLAFAVGAALGALAQSGGWSAAVVVGACVLVAAAAFLAGRRLLDTAQSIRRRHATSWVPEKLRPLRLEVSEGEPRRVNVIHPSIDLKHFFGGFIAVFNLARRLAERGHAVRLIATEPSDLPADWRRRIAAYEGLGEVLDRIEVEFADGRPPTRMNPDDSLIATHWTVAHIAAAAAADLRGEGFVYLIQEYEPFIFPMGSAAALARQSYDLPHRALFSTRLLRDYFAAHRIGVFTEGAGGEADAAVFDNAITPAGPVSEQDLSRPGPRRLLFYARPEEHAQRNLFEIGALAIDRAAGEGALDGWRLTGVGSVEPGTPPLALPESGAEVEMLPRISQADYAELLRSSDLGLALMYTPHPSLVPIEMAAAGMITVTNTFENKDATAMATLSPNLIAVAPTVEAVAAAIGEAAERADGLAARAEGSRVDWPTDWDTALDEPLMQTLDGFLSRP